MALWNRIFFVTLGACLLFGAGVQIAAAQTAVTNEDLIPPMGLVQTAEEQDMPESVTHPILHLTPDRSEIVHLDEPVGSVIVGNPNHVNVLVDSAQRLIVVPRAQGATYVTIMNQKGEVIMQRHIIVAAERKNYIRIRRGCSGGDCQPTSVYYCPDNCHEIRMDEENVESSGLNEANEQSVEAAQNTSNNQNSQNDGDIELP